MLYRIVNRHVGGAPALHNEAELRQLLPLWGYTSPAEQDEFINRLNKGEWIETKHLWFRKEI